MIKKIALFMLGLASIITLSSIALVTYGRSVLGQDHAFTYDSDQYYSTEFRLEEMLSPEQIIDQATYIVEVEVIDQHEQYEKNRLVLAKVTSSKKGDIPVEQTIRIVEPSYGSGFYYQGYIPLSPGKRYVLFLNACQQFSFPAYQFVYAGPAFLTVEEPSFAKWGQEWWVKDLLGTYDYFDNYQDYYMKLKSLYDELF